MSVAKSIALTLVAFLTFMVEGASGQSDAEVWNEGVDYYRSGDVTNALRVLRPLMLTRSHGARAAEVVAKLELERGNNEEAANAAQIALRANPNDAKANRNYTRAVDGLAELRETRLINDVLAQHQGADPSVLMMGATKESRMLMDAIAGYRTNDAVKAVALADELSGRALELSNLWLPVKVAICQAVTNEEQAATIVAQVDQARERTRLAARQTADMEPEAYSTIADVEHDCTRFLKMTILPPEAIGEGMESQSNAWTNAERLNGRDWQQEALDYTRAFRAKFPAWARAYEQQAQNDTNSAPFTAEDQAKISAMATELEKLQMEGLESGDKSIQKRALDMIGEISDLMPKSKSNQPNAAQDGTPQQNDQGDGRQNGEQEQQSEAADKEDGEAQSAEQSEDDKEIEAILRKAQERSDEHEADKKARMRKSPLPPNERDW
ncbi:MAG: hypothetical protein II823_08330 [Kiritimatiellae bacterium]|nr:hypothetical protein [Kiritimatiellia bacterium]